jgi:phenylpropionate dioxygenase-like ring-hydroxylating dioxygenase large terminal subunit
MIPNQWYAITESKTLLRDRPLGLIRMGERLVLWRDSQGNPVCFEDRCAHRGVALSIGKVVNGTIACRYHGLRYNPEGKCVRVPCHGEEYRIPASLQVKRYEVREMNGLVWLWWGEKREQYPAIPWIDEIPPDPRESVSRAAIWPFNYARMVENNFDIQHWAFLHGSIMLNVGEYLADYHCTVSEDNYIESWGTLKRGNRLDKKTGWDFRVAMRFPNLNLIQVTPRFKSLVISTPVDDTTCWVLIRSHQTYSRIPPIRQMIDFYCIQFLFAVPLYRQDFPVFHEQRPTYTDVGVNKLVASDEAIARYLTIRRRLIREAQGDKAVAIADHRTPALPIAQVPDELRNATVGRERPVGKAMAWGRALVAFPLLIPSLTSTKLFGTIGDSKKQ